jgi:hypothetical protein
MSSFAWLDYSEHDRRKALDVIDAFREKETVDELGLGTIRDAFADLFFPGTSTIQTRARYFLFIPWIYQRLEDKEVPSAEIARTARRDEIALINELAESEPMFGAGVIGIIARDRVKRLPSSVYWYGLAVWGIRRFRGSQEQYHRSLDRFYRSRDSAIRADDKELIAVGRMRNWHAGIPSAPPGFPKGTNFSLTRREAEYLGDRVTDAAPRSLMAHFIVHDLAPGDAAFPWEHEAFDELPSHLREQLDHARAFSEALHGSQLLYNLLVAELLASSESTALYRDQLGEWRAMMRRKASVFGAWDRNRLWEIVLGTGARIGHPTRMFVDRWLDLVIRTPGVDVGHDTTARTLVEERERQLKGEQARVKNPRARELWGGKSGAAQLDYRWRSAARILDDLYVGRHKGSGGA